VNIVYGDEVQEEVLVTRVSVINRSPVPVRVGSKYWGLFHGELICYGRHTVRYAVTSKDHQRLITAFMKDYPDLKVDIGASGLERM
jgi:hypothetical protein